MPSTTLRHSLAVIGLIACLAAPAAAQETEGDVHDEAAVQAYTRAVESMHEAMAGMPYSGDADVDFARAMALHHQAAVEMAEIVLEHGSDPDIRALAEAMVETQAAEIEKLEEWLDYYDTAAGDPAVGHGHGQPED